MNNSKEVFEIANRINKFNRELPQVEIGEIVELGDIWDGEGDIPEDSYSYLLTNDGEDGNSNIDVNINYVFEIMQANENPLNNLVKITSVELV